MKTARELSQSLLILLVAVSLMNCSGGENCDFGSADEPARHAETTLAPCPTGTTGTGATCSTTQTPIDTLFSMDSTGTFLEFDISSSTPPLVQICNSVASTLGLLAIAQPNTTAPFLYVLNSTGSPSKIDAFAIKGGKSAALTAVAGQPFSIAGTTSTTGLRIKTDPLGEFVFVTDPGKGQVHVFQIDLVNLPTLGALTEVAGSPFAVANASSIAVDLTDSFAYVTDPIDGQIFIFDFNTPTAGALTPAPIVPNPMQIVSAPDFPNFAHAAATSLSVEVLFTANTSSISGYTVNVDGSLTALAGSPYEDAGTLHISPVGIAVDPASEDLYVLSSNSGGILGYQMDTTGNLTLAAGSPFLANTAVHDITIRGETLYVEEGTASPFSINPFAINTTSGGLTAIPQTTTPNNAATNIVTAITE